MPGHGASHPGAGRSGSRAKLPGDDGMAIEGVVLWRPTQRPDLRSSSRNTARSALGFPSVGKCGGCLLPVPLLRGRWRPAASPTGPEMYTRDRDLARQNRASGRVGPHRLSRLCSPILSNRISVFAARITAAQNGIGLFATETVKMLGNAIVGRCKNGRRQKCRIGCTGLADRHGRDRYARRHLCDR